MVVMLVAAMAAVGAAAVMVTVMPARRLVDSRVR